MRVLFYTLSIQFARTRERVHNISIQTERYFEINYIV